MLNNSLFVIERARPEEAEKLLDYDLDQEICECRAGVHNDDVNA